MRILQDAESLGDPPAPVSLAIGVFDGVHLGHQSVIRRTLDDARAAGGLAAAVTFDPHPAAVLVPSQAPALLLPLWRRLEIIEALGIDVALVFRFDHAFSRQPAEAFVQRLLQGFRRLTSICVGTGFVFGRDRTGNVDTLRAFGRQAGFAVHGLPPSVLDGEMISSTRVREAVGQGDMARASAMMGRPYALAGVVGRGDGLGRHWGFPTANLDVAGLVVPPHGVYAARAVGNGWSRPAAVNIGVRPTVDRSTARLRVEAHLLDFQGDLYDQRLGLEFGRRIRGEVRFESTDSLVAQIGRDVTEVRRWAENAGLLGPVPRL